MPSGANAGLDLTHPTSVVDLEEADKLPFQTGTQFLTLLNKSSQGCNQRTRRQRYERSLQGQGTSKHVSQEASFSWEVGFYF